ncbi:hypothetical protein [Halomonas binhaiensis]|uniref:Uncharacterized protein n=1 Tax=Halomonas binhaiensis TaxID=2562282 RepID=A0A5C1NH93_9GAMM|nr:hypothetical protein [Halomonas binhaiensis]QEM82646.1 hypothetical protein E4T21_14635 [Halomonas binhaiensis]
MSGGIRAFIPNLSHGLSIAGYRPPAIYCRLSTTYYPLPAIDHLLSIAGYRPPAIHCRLSITNYPPLTTHCWQPTTDN